MHYWLVKTEPSVYSIDDLKKDKTTCWDSIRNYQARNFLMAMRKGDFVLVYHSNATPPGIAGVAMVVKVAYPDPVQFDVTSDYFDPKATLEDPRWFSPDLKFSKKFSQLIELERLRGEKPLQKMSLLQKGSRLSVHQISEDEFTHILSLAS